MLHFRKAIFTSKLGKLGGASNQSDSIRGVLVSNFVDAGYLLFQFVLACKWV